MVKNMGPKRKKRNARPFPKGRHATTAEIDAVASLLGDTLIHGEPGRTLLLEHLHALHDAFGELRAGHMSALAKLMGLAQVEVYETASFYAHFTLAPEDVRDASPTPVRICNGPACRMAGSAALIAEAHDALGESVAVIPAPCQGACERAPSAIINNIRVSPANILALKMRECAPAPTILVPPVLKPTGLHEKLAAAGLRGMGGAGFPVAKKWAFFDGAPHPRVLVVNADEGEPGTFKDRHLLETEGQTVLTGMLLAAQALDVQDVFFYLRDEYPHLHASLKQTFKNLDVPGITLHLRRGAGAYVCGEETALIESLEGRRGQPRNRPPYPAQSGYLGRPTITQNVETLYWIADIHARGADAYLAAGSPRFYSVSGRVKNPGTYRAPSKITVAGLVELAGGMADGHYFKAFLPGGASGGFTPRVTPTGSWTSACSKKSAASSAPAR